MQVNKVDSSFKFEQSLINCCYIVSYGFDTSYVDENGNVQVKKVTKYNVMKPTGTLVCDPWFDVYRVNDEGEVIFGVEKSVADYERTLSLYNLEEIGPKLVPTEHGHMLIEGTSLEDTVKDLYKYSYGFINKEGNKVIEPIHDNLEFASENTCIATRIDNLLSFGYFDTLDGHQITPIRFSQAHDFYDGLARVKYRHKYAFVDRNKIMTDPSVAEQYGIAPMVGAVSNFVDGKAKVVVGNRFTHYIDREGKVTNPPYVMRKKKNSEVI